MGKAFSVDVISKILLRIFVLSTLFVFAKSTSAQVSSEQQAQSQAQIDASIEHLQQLRSNKAYWQVHEALDLLMPDVLAQDDEELTIRVLNLRAATYYDQGRYDNALPVYNKMLTYLSEDDNTTIATKGRILHQIGQTYKRLKDFEMALSFHNKALAAHTFLQDKALIARSLKNVAILEFKLNNLRRSLEYIYQSMALHEELDDPKEQAELLVLAGSAFRQLSRYETSLAYLDKALNMYRDMEDVGKIAESLNQMGLLYSRLGKYSEAQLLYQESIALPHDKVPSRTLAGAYREIAVHEMEKGQYDFAMEMVQHAHTIFTKTDERAKAIITARIIGEIYQKTDNTIKARQYYRESIRLGELANNDIGQIKALIRLANSYLNENVNESQKLYKQALVLATGSGHHSEVASIYRQLLNIEKSQRNYQKALTLAEDLIKVSKAIYKEAEQNKLAYAKANLETHLMEAELDSLREKLELDKLTLLKKNNEIEIAKQSSRIAELELIKNRYTKISLIVLLAVCFCIVIYTYRIFNASRKRNVELDYLADHDHLTKCYNRRGLFNIFERELESRDQQQSYCIVMADIDHFKDVNDTHGHDAGDEVLICFVERLKSTVRKGDVVARYGGEEFCILLPNTSIEQAVRVAEKMRLSIEEMPFDNIRVTCSFGVAEFDQQQDTPISMISKADSALYFSKTNGRNQVTIWDQKLDATQSESGSQNA